MYRLIGRVVVALGVGIAGGIAYDIVWDKIRKTNVYSNTKRRTTEACARYTGLAKKVWANARPHKSATPQAKAQTQDDPAPYGVALTCVDCGHPYIRCFDICVRPECIHNREKMAC